LTENEKCLKQQIEESIRDFYKLYEEFTQNKTSLDSDVYNHLHELRFQIDEHREKLKQKIDDIALAMIEQTQKFEAEYLKTLNDQLDAPLESYNKISIDNDFKEIEELFRDPNLLLESIQGLQRKEQDAIGSIRFKLNEMSQIRDLKKSNAFDPNLSFDRLSFGSLYLKDFLTIDPFNSSILKGSQSMDLIKLCKFSKKDKWALLYRASRDGFLAKDFHEKCDGKPKTLTIFKAKDSSFIFGGFTSAAWESLSQGQHKSDQTAFIFSLTNKDKQPFKSKIQPNQHGHAILCCSKEGPSFGLIDIMINNSFNSDLSMSNFGKSYIYPHGYIFDSFILAGSNKFLLSEIEVFKKE
jgi:hypothetical protein